jgi:hypothetical protein
MENSAFIILITAIAAHGQMSTSHTPNSNATKAEGFVDGEPFEGIESAGQVAGRRE